MQNFTSEPLLKTSFDASSISHAGPLTTRHSAPLSTRSAENSSSIRNTTSTEKSSNTDNKQVISTQVGPTQVGSTQVGSTQPPLTMRNRIVSDEPSVQSVVPVPPSTRANVNPSTGSAVSGPTDPASKGSTEQSAQTAQSASASTSALSATVPSVSIQASSVAITPGELIPNPLTVLEKKKFAPTRDVDVIKKQDVFRDEGVRSLLMMMVHLCDLYVQQVNVKTKQQVDLLQKKYGKHVAIDVLEIRKDCLSNAQYWSAEIKKQNEVEAKEYWPMIGKYYEYSLGLLVQATKLVDPCLTDIDDTVPFNDESGTANEKRERAFTFSAPPFNEFLHQFYRNCSTDSSVVHGNIELLSEDQKALVCKYILRKTLQHCCNLVSRSEVFGHVQNRFPGSSSAVAAAAAASEVKFRGSKNVTEDDGQRFIVPQPVVTSIQQQSQKFSQFGPAVIQPIQSGISKVNNNIDSRNSSHPTTTTEPTPRSAAAQPFGNLTTSSSIPKFASQIVRQASQNPQVPMTARASTSGPRYTGAPLVLPTNTAPNNTAATNTNNSKNNEIYSSTLTGSATSTKTTPNTPAKTVNVDTSRSSRKSPRVTPSDRHSDRRHSGDDRNYGPKYDDCRNERNERNERNDRNERNGRNESYARNETYWRNERDYGHNAREEDRHDNHDPRYNNDYDDRYNNARSHGGRDGDRYSRSERRDYDRPSTNQWRDSRDDSPRY